MASRTHWCIVANNCYHTCPKIIGAGKNENPREAKIVELECIVGWLPIKSGNARPIAFRAASSSMQSWSVIAPRESPVS